MLLLMIVACGGPGELTAEEQMMADMAEYDDLLAALNDNRVEAFDESARSMIAVGPNLFFTREQGLVDPEVFVVSPGAEPVVVTTLQAEHVNYRVSEDLLITAVPDGNVVEYRAFDLTGEHLGTNVLEAPNGEVRWFAYAADGDQFYIVNEDDDTINRVQPGDAPEVVTTFGDLGVDLQIFWDFSVADDQMLFIDNGGLWQADLAAEIAHFVGNETQAVGAAVMDDSTLVYATSSTVVVVRDGHFSDLAELLAASPYQLNETYALAHHLDDSLNWTIFQSMIVYVGNDGVFGYDLDSGAIEPLLLEVNKAGDRVEYRYPAVVSDGTLYIKGLHSESGAVGSDGPVYSVRHPLLTR